LVNLYLHGFADPHIYEYDTLTSQDRWNEYSDVILANPPFMSPKGGIKPHNRFSVQSKRSEVLFVDYMAEHLTPSGRAGIIVPEGIIFQSQTAYTQLRKLLVEEYLVAVVSLPAGVFNPYSGVKTSILILDKSLAKKTAAIAFFKIENDGFGLGAQRREIVKNNLPQAHAEIGEYLRRLRAGESVADFQPTLGLIVEKEKITANGDYNLSGERYRKETAQNHVFPLVRIGDICTVNPRKSQLAELPSDTRVSFVPMADLNEHRIAFQPIEEKRLSEVSASYTYFEDNDVLLAKVTPCFENGKAGIARGLLNGLGFGSSEFYVLRPTSQVLPEWIYFCVTHPLFRDAAIAQMTGTGGLQRVPRSYVEAFQIPLPPLEVQKEIVAEIEGYQKVINGARAVLDNYRPHIPIHPDWPLVAIGDACSTSSGGTPLSGNAAYYESGTIPWLRSGEVAQGEVFRSELFITEEGLRHSSAKVFPINTVLVAMYGATAGEVGILRFEASTNQAVCGITPDQRLSPDFLYLILKTDKPALIRLAGGGAQPNISQKIIREFEIPLPPLATQQAIVAEIEAEQALVAANRELIARFEKKIQATLARVWGEGKKYVNSVPTST
jgi:type I restriction enzyme M protein